MQDVEPGNVGDRRRADADFSSRAGVQRRVGEVALGRGEALGIVEQNGNRIGHAGAEQDGGGDHRTRERTSACFVDAGDAAAVGRLEFIVRHKRREALLF
jgi:hypothetical protein